MNTPTTVTDEMVKEFLAQEHAPCNIPYVLERWEHHKSQHSSPVSKEWEILVTTKNEDSAGSDRIMSVRRLSDSAVFSIGDEVKLRMHNPCKILSFEIVGGGRVMYVGGNFVHDNVFQNEDLMRIEKAPANTPKPVIFVSEDGKEIRKGDTIWYVRLSDFIIHSNLANSFDGKNPAYKYFSTKEAANSFVAWNKRCLSMNDLLSISSLIAIDGTNYKDWPKDISYVFTIEKLNELAQSKIKGV